MANETFDSDSGIRNSRSAYRPAIIALLLLIVAAGGWYIYQTFVSGSRTTALQEELTWSLNPIETPISTQTAISLRIADVDVPVGTFEGACQIIDGEEWKLLPGEITGVVCQVEGGGTEVGVFDEEGQLVLKRGTIVGNGPTVAERSNFVPIVSAS